MRRISPQPNQKIHPVDEVLALSAGVFLARMRNFS
jgi:hypothetical protein